MGIIATILKEVEELVLTSGGLKQKLDGVADSVQPVKGCKVLGDSIHGMKMIGKMLLIMMAIRCCCCYYYYCYL